MEPGTEIKEEIRSVTVTLREEHIEALDEWSKQYDGNRSMVVRRLIEAEVDRRKGSGTRDEK